MEETLKPVVDLVNAGKVQEALEYLRNSDDTFLKEVLNRWENGNTRFKILEEYIEYKNHDLQSMLKWDREDLKSLEQAKDTFAVEGLGNDYRTKEQLLDAFRDKYPHVHARLSKDGNSIEIVKADWTKGKTTEQVASERKTRRAVERINETAQRLGLDVEIKTDTEGLEGQQKNALGYYDTKTGKITIVLPNHTGTQDVVRTLLHEGVAHLKACENIAQGNALGFMLANNCRPERAKVLIFSAFALLWRC